MSAATKVKAPPELRAIMQSGRWRASILAASKFAELGEQRGAILSAREAYLRPEFQRQLGRDPERLIKVGIAAMKVRYGE